MVVENFYVKGAKHYMDDMTPIAKAIWYYLYSRKLEGLGAATRKEIIEDLAIDQKTATSALRLLRAKNAIESCVMHRASGKPDMGFFNDSN